MKAQNEPGFLTMCNGDTFGQSYDPGAHLGTLPEPKDLTGNLLNWIQHMLAVFTCSETHSP